VDAFAEAEVTGTAAGDVEPIGVGELPGIAVRRTGDENDSRTRRDRHPVQPHLPRGRPGGQLQRGDVPQCLLDRGRDERGVALQQRALVGVLGEQLEQVAGQPGGRLDAAEVEHEHEPAHLGRRRHLLRHERHAVDVAADEMGHEVVPGVTTAFLEQVDEVLLDARGGRPRDRRQVRRAGDAVLQLVGPALELVASRELLGVPLLPARQAHHVEEDVERHRPRQVLGQVDRAAVLPDLDEVPHHRADAGLQLRHPPRQEVGLDDAADLVVPRVVHVRQRPRRGLLEGAVVDVHALEAAERVRVEDGLAHVVEPGQRPPAPSVAAVDGSLLPHGPVDRERIRRVEVRREGVVLHLGAGDRHRVSTHFWGLRDEAEAGQDP
jgi:hypothetical protein